jgi:imidazole glycerol-phosphate synthase subunit HisH
MKVSIINYQIGNHSSLINIFKNLNCKVQLSSKSSVLEKSDLIVLPGVGAFGAAMRELQNQKLTSFLVDWAEQKQYVLGICLGMQLMCEKSYEHVETKGLGIIPGSIVKLDSSKIHVGWNYFNLLKDDYLFGKFDANYFYFNHSFFYDGLEEFQVATSKYTQKIPSIIRNNNAFGFQFHPEKSQDAGKNLLEAFIESIRDAN